MGDMNLTVSALLPLKDTEETAENLRKFFADVTDVYESWHEGERGGDDPAGWWKRVKRDHPPTFAYLTWRLDNKPTETHPGHLVGMISWVGSREAQEFNRDKWEWCFSTNCSTWAETHFLKCYLLMHFPRTVVYVAERTYKQFVADRKRRIAARKRREERQKQAANA